MVLGGEPSPNDEPLEHDREAFIQEAVMYAQRTYALEQEMASLQIGPTGPRQPHTVPNASRTISRRKVIGHPAVAPKIQSANPDVAILPVALRAVRQLEATGLERHQIPQLIKAVNNQIEQAVDYLASPAPGDLHDEQPMTLAIPASQNPTLRSVMTRRGQSTALPSAKQANLIQATPKSVARASITSQISLDHSDPSNTRDTCAFGAAVLEGPKAGSSKSSTIKQLPGSNNAIIKRITVPTKVNVTDTKAQGRKPLPSSGDTHNKETASRLLNHRLLSPAQFELEIQKIIPANSYDQDIQLEDAVFDRIAEVLLHADLEAWSFRPRTYAVLKMINAANLMDDFVKVGCLDIAFPYRRGHLPKSLSPEQLDHFLEKQNRVMTKTASIEGGLEAKHANFADDADNHLEVLNELGDGGTGVVDRIRSKLSRKIYARKRLKREETFEQNLDALKLFKREVSHLKKLRHRHLVRYVGSYTDPQHVGIIMDPVADMDLKTFLSQSAFNTAEYDCIREAFGCLCSAIIYLHRQSIRHKDIKPQNILVRQRKIFITDFGLAISWKTLGKGTTTGEHGPISREYAAPEVMDNCIERRDHRGKVSLFSEQQQL
ncbi:MAG: hypothetical protein Q9170_003892 [Blastenia crenularia]